MTETTSPFFPPAAAKPSRCPGCGGDFVCGAEAGLSRCWCMEMPKGVVVPESGKGCYCQNCLTRLAEAALAESRG
ncbi:MAG TPA: cysteine-rich CWC family protein [Azospira sp.]|nr:cysteine-rich CWC family protein [Azospira sp.]